MKKEQHKIAAKKHFSIAKEIDKDIISETDEDIKLALITVSAQNYFYAAINAVEYVFAGLKDPVHSNDHKSRTSNLYSNTQFFKNKEIYFDYKTINIETRRQVAYRAANGKKYKKLKQFAEKCMEELNEQI
ncbi:hypothetical protein JXB41_07980 [Candidatus Woesearchaeota archaeon]|nr:hypothetical protein [Candidatus Woesearchaeota archaeon]